jgi:hypothetical protein
MVDQSRTIFLFFYARHYKELLTCIYLSTQSNFVLFGCNISSKIHFKSRFTIGIEHVLTHIVKHKPNVKMDLNKWNIRR